MRSEEVSGTTDVVMPVSDLRGRSVWTDDGERIGTIRSVEHDEDGRIVAFEVRERWMLGPHHTVAARGMRFDDGDVVLPVSAVVEMETREARGDTSRRRSTNVRRDTTATAAPVFIQGREGARGRFGGLDVLGSFVGGLVIIAAVVLVGGVLAAIFGTGSVNVDTSLDSFNAVTSGALLVGAATLFVSALLGGWAAGRASRFDGVGNGLAAAVWALAMGVGFGLLGWAFGNDYDVYANTNLPRFTTDEFALWGGIAFALAIVLLLVGGMLGGMIGELWHRRVDRSLMSSVAVDGARDSALMPDSADAMPAGMSVADETPEARAVRIRNLDE
ncbi:MAG: hypothetical protein JWM98_2642 [Thermoleophilia bacterium]|nr:hypothetical protein [Thermoleophilia bacterium]